MEVAYWKNASQIHAWLDRHVQGGVKNLEFYPISQHLLERLVSDRQWVLGHPDKATEVLPNKFGFFFYMGNGGYDEEYRENLEDTIEQVSRVLQTTDFDNAVIYYLAWWYLQYQALRRGLGRERMDGGLPRCAE